MNTQKEFSRMMATQSEIALASSVSNIPNVRLVNFVFDEEKKTIYFATFGDNEKVKEFESNNNVAITTIPKSGNEHAKAKGIIKKSELSILDVAEAFKRKIPGYADTIEQAGQFLVLYEIKFDEAVVTLDFMNIDTLKL